MNKDIIIVDDDPIILLLIKSWLSKENYQLFTASNGREGLEQLKLTKPVLIITDYVMPVMNGGEFIEEIRTKCMDKTTPIILCSSMSKESVKKFLTDKNTIFLSKPLIKENILSVINSMLKFSNQE